ncbi:IMP dehydrogenase [Actinoplanes regularis]|uniref:IMP dehydrogenase n=1 Tax=Actinoplanes regularis TaxID=52697 RepID=A0A239DXQ7_9ACTN|nr:IMP dehydrogenase [Actinoplanes regularis]GIE88948.1 inosine 5-monophosphate dehydrogenase [Actinoplanes regularis]GLW34992.1 inosine 5-monophosphate dehydrogenase [Actinoplanes regularis]SNS37246.1 IMP dehydrogenase [Actinoplanes regularis]
MRILPEISRTFGEYLLVPNLTDETCTPDNVDLSTPLVRHPVGEESPIRIATPLVSAIMGAVSSPQLAIALAQVGGISFVHQNQPIDEQAAMVSAVKKHKAGFRHNDVNIKPTATLGEADALLRSTGRAVAVVTDDGTPPGAFLGLITAQDFNFHRHRVDDSVESRMRRGAELVTGTPGMSLSTANELLWDSRQDVLPIVGADGRVTALVQRRDYELHKQFSYESVDDHKQFRVGAGVNTRDYRERIPALVEAGADVLCLDSSDGYSVWQREVLEFVRKEYGDAVRIGAGNVVDARGFEYLADAGADFVKVGIGGGSICITRDQKGIGRGQASALAEIVAARDAYTQRTGMYVPLCSDGGVLHDSHMAIAFAFGADFLMLGRYFARFTESPAPLVKIRGQALKEYWGEGSARARNVARYGQGTELHFEEGVDGYVPYAGSLYDNVKVTLAKLRSTMISCGSTTLRRFHDTATLVQVSQQTFVQNSEDVERNERPTVG